MWPTSNVVQAAAQDLPDSDDESEHDSDEQTSTTTGTRTLNGAGFPRVPSGTAWPPLPPSSRPPGPAASTPSASQPAPAPAPAQQAGEKRQQNDSSTSLVVSPAAWTAVGRVAGSAWTLLKLCHRHLLVPAASWALQQLRLYVEEQIAVQRRMASTPCPVRRLGEAELRAASDDFAFTARVLGTPYGLVVYLAQLEGREVAIRQMTLSSLADVDAFWAEAAAGAALQAAGAHPCIVPYAGCCPGQACHVYERPGLGILAAAAGSSPADVTGPGSGAGSSAGSGRPAGSRAPKELSLRDVLRSSHPLYGITLDWGWRLAACQQLVGAVAQLLKAGVEASEISAAHIVTRMEGGPPSADGGSGSGGTGSPEPLCLLAPGCGFRAPAGPPPGSARAPLTPAAAAAAAERVAAMGRGLGQVLMQLLCGADAPPPAPPAVLSALADACPAGLLCGGVAPPLTHDQAWPLLGAVYPLLVWGTEAAGSAGGGPGAGAGPGGSGRGAGGPGAGAAGPVGARGGGGVAAGAGGGGGPQAGSDAAVALQGHLLRELGPAIAELRRELRAAVEARPRPSAPPPPALHPPPPPARAHVPAGPGPGPGAGFAPAYAADPFAEASAPPLLPDPTSAPPPWAGPTGAHGHGHGSGLGPGTVPGPGTGAGAGAGAVPAGYAGVQGLPPAWVPGPSSGPWQGAAGGLAGAMEWPPEAPSSGCGAATAPPGAGLADHAAKGPSAPPPPTPPPEFLCPITQDLMSDPVVAADGHSYERAAIAQWLGAGAAAARSGRRGPTSPLTGAPLPSTALTPNYALRSMIRDWRERQGV
ncbi:hypothetical protein HYH03_001583 [Edaphochlamys debaryana]|uniref:U-box domain-containing protein n=1 Tax=Edaphochlamys debaryana TaxID=47281 RepID=A0A835YDY4_9CHLO|nr:hypothetical protein HYH03_001583 [Edaphochlamys debaryana]|eukprot:KAG2500821.1 hypothetical protein HYH03_001583 [Edaphochlamys debaryana]